MRHAARLMTVALLAAGCSSASKSGGSSGSAAAPPPAPPAAAKPAGPPPAIGTTLPQGAVVIDNEDKDGRFQTVGNWSEDPAGGDNGSSSHWTFPDAEGKSKLIWSATLPKAGRYHVYVWHGEDPNYDHATDAPFTVEYDGGQQTFKIDLTKQASTWKPLGTFPFSAAKPARVVLSNNADRNVIGDAVMFLPEGR